MPASEARRLLVFGATGRVGRRVVVEALRRGHRVTAALRSIRPHGLPEEVEVCHGDVLDPCDVRRLSEGQDAVVSATRPPDGQERALVRAAESLLLGLANTGCRLLVVGGAASLRVPDDTNRLVLDDPRFVPAEWRAIARACVDQLAACQGQPSVAWTYISPPALLEEGERTGGYRSDTDRLVMDRSGRSRISYEDLAVAVVDELEVPRHLRARFTVGY